MAVYVDDFYETGVRYRGMKMCHMVADSQKELFEMVDKIGVQRKWVQDYNKPREHFDICFSKRKLAIEHGAIEIGFRELAAKTKNRELNK